MNTSPDGKVCVIIAALSGICEPTARALAGLWKSGLHAMVTDESAQNQGRLEELSCPQSRGRALERIEAGPALPDHGFCTSQAPQCCGRCPAGLGTSPGFARSHSTMAGRIRR